MFVETCGNPHYTAPEVFLVNGIVDKKHISGAVALFYTQCYLDICRLMGATRGLHSDW